MQVPEIMTTGITTVGRNDDVRMVDDLYKWQSPLSCTTLVKTRQLKVGQIRDRLRPNGMTGDMAVTGNPPASARRTPWPSAPGKPDITTRV